MDRNVGKCFHVVRALFKTWQVHNIYKFITFIKLVTCYLAARSMTRMVCDDECITSTCTEGTIVWLDIHYRLPWEIFIFSEFRHLVDIAGCHQWFMIFMILIRKRGTHRRKYLVFNLKLPLEISLSPCWVYILKYNNI